MYNSGRVASFKVPANLGKKLPTIRPTKKSYDKTCFARKLQGPADTALGRISGSDIGKVPRQPAGVADPEDQGKSQHKPADIDTHGDGADLHNEQHKNIS